jgi:cytochrome c553
MLANLLTTVVVVFHAPVASALLGEEKASHVREPDRPSFDQDVRPILQKCIGCHGPDQPQAGLCLTNRTAAIELGAIVPHDLNASSLVARITSDDPDLRMPPDAALDQQQIAVLSHWIATGADWPDHWSYRTLSTPSLPSVTDQLKNWCKNPIDYFVAARLQQSGLAPSPPADRRTLLRRLYFDLLGLPPTDDEVRRFQQDKRPDAYPRVVESLLASPRYGERWARHWMDIVHFAETHGHDQDRPRDHAWPYRDYLIRRFNADVAYSRFVREQIAGDTLYPQDAWSTVATGFLAAGPWDESSLRDIQENSIDREIARYLDRDDIVTTVMSTFASTSVHCARCHHHKFDPITQDEYYGLQAVFSGIDKANRKYDAAPSVAKRRRALNNALTEISSWTDKNGGTKLTETLQIAVTKWEEQQREHLVRWSALQLLDVRSAAGQTMTRESDHSIYVDGARPERDRYTINVKSDLQDVRAIRLTVLADDRLPKQGPGRQDNGNFHLSEIRVYEVNEQDPDWQRQVSITKASCDFEQADWTVAKSIDGDLNTAWGIHPRVGQTHEAVFELGPTEFSTFRIELDQVHGGGHIIGRFELAATDHPGPLPTRPALPSKIIATLSKQIDLRSDAEQIRLAAFVEQQRISKELAQLPPQSIVYCGTNQFDPDGSFRPTAEPRDVHVLDRGEIDKPLRLADATTLSCVTGVNTELQVDSESESERRERLASWLASRQNGLVWRSIANRVAQYHFGKPLVDTPNDFGMAGSAPTHPQLLDWLAAELQSNGGFLKSLHRAIVTSATYQQSSNHRPDAAKIDADNRMLWRMNRARLDAESFRDSLLLLSDTLDHRMGGPSDRQFVQSPGIHVTPVVDYQAYDPNDRSNFRRSVYRFLFRTVPDPFMEALDCPDAAQLTPQRGESLTAVQTLATMNDKFVVRQCELIADRLRSECSSTGEQVAQAFRIALCRSATPDELSAVTAYVEQHGLANACRLLVNTNEFMFVD